MQIDPHCNERIGRENLFIRPAQQNGQEEWAQKIFLVSFQLSSSVLDSEPKKQKAKQRSY